VDGSELARRIFTSQVWYSREKRWQRNSMLTNSTWRSSIRSTVSATTTAPNVMRDVLDGLIERNLAMIEDEPTLPDDMTAKQALELEMRGRIKLSPSQFRAAKELLPYENPKLTAVMTSQMDHSSFAAALERAILRSKSPPPPPAALPAPQHPASEVRKPFTLPRRNFR